MRKILTFLCLFFLCCRLVRRYARPSLFLATRIPLIRALSPQVRLAGIRYRQRRT